MGGEWEGGGGSVGGGSLCSILCSMERVVSVDVLVWEVHGAALMFRVWDVCRWGHSKGYLA